MKLHIWHDNAPKYFNYLSDEMELVYCNIHFFRYLLGKNKTKTIPSGGKAQKLGKFNLICLAPFDLNIILFCLYKSFLFKSSRLILHTSAPDHQKGYILRYRVSRWVWYYCVKHYFDCVVTPIPSLVSHLEEIYNKPVYLITHPVDLPETLAERSAANEKIVISFLGDLIFKKGIDRFINLGVNLNRSCFHFKIAGKNVDNIIIPPHIQYHGNLTKNEVASFLSDTDILCVPSRRVNGWEELFGIVIIEALYSGCAVIASDHIGPNDIDGLLECLTLVEDSDESWELNVDEILKVVEKPRLSPQALERYFSTKINREKFRNVLSSI